MKKRNLFFSAIAGMMVFTACSNEEGLPNSGVDNAVQEINLQVANYGDELQTRAGRELLSDEAAQKIDKVTVFICDGDGTIKYIKTVDQWMTNADVVDYTNGRQTKLRLQGDDKLPIGSYKIYAFGYSDNSDYDLSAITSLTKGAKYTENVVLDYKAGKSVPEEIFAGAFNDLSVGADKSFTANVVLNRQVAGAYIYAKNIPYVDGMNENYELRLYASDANDQLVLGYFISYDLANNGTGNTGHINYIVNGGKKGTPSTIVCSTKLGEWYSAFTDDDNNKILDDKNWRETAEGRNGNKYYKGSVFAANFVIPFKRVDGKQTLWLELVKDNGERAFFWNVNLPSTELAVNQKFTFWNSTTSTFETVQSYTNTNSVYSIVRNHLYSVGKKTTDGTDPTDPDPDPDGPQDLSKSQNINLNVNHNWEVIHRMELE